MGHYIFKDGKILIADDDISSKSKPNFGEQLAVLIKLEPNINSLPNKKSHKKKDEHHGQSN